MGGESAELSAAIREAARWPRLGVVLDLDGTLLPLAPTPMHAWISEHEAELLAELASISGTHVAIVSGRRRMELDAMLGRVPGLWLLPEHGAWRKAPGGVWSATPLKGERPHALHVALAAVTEGYAGSFVERKAWAACVHYAAVVPEERDALLSAVATIARAWLAAHAEYELVGGRQAIEVGHVGANKGAAVAWLERMWPAGTRFVVIGDDTADENAFAQVAAGDLTIRVAPSSQPTHARLFVSDVAAVRALLRTLAQTRRSIVESGLGASYSGRADPSGAHSVGAAPAEAGTTDRAPRKRRISR